MAAESVDIVIPLRGSVQELEELVAGLSEIPFERVATLTVVDNSAGARPDSRGPVRIVAAPNIPSSYHARNRGAAAGEAPWILFLDADVEAPPGIVPRYFDPPPGDDVGVLTGGVNDEPPADAATAPAVVYAHRSSHMSQFNTLRRGRWPYAQTANCAVRREALEAVGGFVDDIRSAGDADLCFRLAAAGWRIEERPDAAVVHRSRRTVRAVMAQRVRHGAGVAWANERHPGSFPPRRLLRWPALAAWSLLQAVRAFGLLALGRRRDALVELVGPLSHWAFEYGRLTSNEAGEMHPRPEAPDETPGRLQHPAATSSSSSSSS
jgi:mycofactocin glycosyltransferase